MAIIKNINNKNIEYANKSKIDHSQLSGREAYGAHPISAIRKLPEKLSALNTKINDTNEEIDSFNIPGMQQQIQANQESIDTIEQNVNNIDIIENDDSTFTFTNYNGESKTIQSGFLPDDSTLQLQENKLTLKQVFTNESLTGDGTQDNPLSFNYSFDAETLSTSDNVIQVIGIKDDTTSYTPISLQNNFNQINQNITNQSSQISILASKIDALEGVGGYLTPYDFGVAEPSQTALTNEALQQIFDDPSAHTQTEIWNGTRIKNLYDNHLWILNNTPDTDPAIFEWVNDGLDTVNIASDSSLGVVKGNNIDAYKVSVNNVTGEMTVNQLEDTVDTINNNIENIDTELNTINNNIDTINSDITNIEQNKADKSEIPTTLPNPQKLTINQDGEAVEYDGSVPVTFTVDPCAIKILVGTDENPINLATDLDTGKAYILKGNISLSKTNIQTYDFLYGVKRLGQYSLTEQYFCLKNTDTSVYFIGSSLEKFSSGMLVNLRNNFGNSCTLSFNTQGNITGSNVYFSIREINNNFSRDGSGPDNIQGSASFYAPFTSGNAGQILQSNGLGNTPTWIDFSQGVTTLVGTEDQPINLATDMEVGNYYLITGYITRNQVTTYNISYQQLAYKLDDTNIILFNTTGLDANDGPAFGISINVNILETGYVNSITRDTGITSMNGVVSNSMFRFYAPTTSGASGQILQSNGSGKAPTWVDMPSGSSGIIQLTGTAESPINLATSLTTGQLYSCKGVINAGTDYSFTSLGDTDDNFLLYKWSDTGIYALTCSASDIDGVTHIFNGYQGICYIIIDTSGNITGVSNANFINLLNGNSNVEPGTPLSIYAPTTSGEAGQLLQSNGADQAPSWNSLSTTISESSTDSEIPSALAVYNLIQSSIVSALGGNY